MARTRRYVQLAGLLHDGVDAALRERGERLIGETRGTIDLYGGVCATVGRSHRAADVRAMPSLPDARTLLASCTCAVDEVACEHIWAVVCAIDQAGAWPIDQRVPSIIAITDPEDPDLDLIDEDGEVFAGTAAALAPTSITLAPAARFARWSPPRSIEWRHGFPAMALPVHKVVSVTYTLDAHAVGTDRCEDDRARLDLAVPTGTFERDRLCLEDREVYDQLFGVRQPVLHRERFEDRKRTTLQIGTARIADTLARLAATGRFGWRDRDGSWRALTWDDRGPWALRVTIARNPAGSGACVTGVLVRGDERLALDAIVALAGGRVAIAGARALQVSTHFLGRWLELFAAPVVLPLRDVATFIEATCRHRHPPELVIDDVGLAIHEEAPAGRITLRASGRAGYQADAAFGYGKHAVPVGAPPSVLEAFGKRLVRRDRDREATIAIALRELGASPHGTWIVSGPKLRALCDGAAARGIEVWYDGTPIRRTATVEARVSSGIDWFDLEVVVEGKEDASAELPDLLASLRTGKPFVRLSDGSTVMLPAWLEARAGALTAAREHDGALRFRRSETLLLAAMLDGLDDPTLDKRFAELRDRLDHFTGLAPRDAPTTFGATLRDYQRDGLGWLAFLRELGLGGCLADDMGLGKTVQVLAHLEGIRAARRKRVARKPTLVVAPRSLVFHWLGEARRFSPELVTLEWHGAARKERAAELAQVDLVVTTYATMKLDLAVLQAVAFDTVILDEAQAIKNAGTAVAKAACALVADHRIALTGTPVENRLDDLASIFEFLNPGMLGRPGALRAIAASTRGGEAPDHDDDKGVDVTHARALGRVLRPFLLRRTKQEVLTELPAKTERIITCRLEGAERRRYDELKAFYRNSLLPQVEARGVQRSAIVVLEALLRLRQAALHPGLLDSRELDADSAKLDALSEQLLEVTASGHRALVFSQFTSLLAIVGRRLEREAIAYEYLDGQTRDRRERVERFQRGGTPVFLLSLKAGGTGLNLTAADHVFILDPWWNPAVEAQAIDRVHRIGQDRPVTAYRLIAEDTVEDKLVALQAHKRALFDSVFDETGLVANLSVETLRTLLA